MGKQEPYSVVHLLIRYSDTLAPESGTITEHVKIIKRRGYAWLGKFGRGIGVGIRTSINGQIKEGVETYLFLVGNKAREYIYIAKILGIENFIGDDEIQRVPLYYRHQASSVGTWVKIAEIWRVERSILSKVDNSFGLPMSQTVGKSMSGHLIVRTQPCFTFKKMGKKEI